MMADGGSCDVVCDLCEDEQALSFCDECHSKLCTFCQALHIRQKKTYTHDLTTIEQIKLSLLNVKCSFCDGKAERFCAECNIRLCTKCAVSHHKLCDIPGTPMQASGDHASDGQATYGVSDRTTNPTKNNNEGLSHDSSKILFMDSVPQRSTIIVKDLHVQSGVLCDLCEEDILAWFCADCQIQMCAFCQQGHIKQKRTKYHKLSAIENTTRSILHTICSSCNQHAGKVCNQCEVRFCTKCSDAHHYLSDTLVLRKEISNTEHECEDQVSGRHFRPGSFVYKLDTVNAALQPPENGINRAQFHQVGDQECDGEVSGKVNKSKGLSAEGGAGKCVNDKRGQTINRDDTRNDEESNGGVSMKDTNIKVNRPGKPVVKRVSRDSVDIEWNAVSSFCNGDVYQVRYENTENRKWNCQNFEINRGKIMSLQSGTSYIFSVRLVKSNGEEGKYGETSKEVRTQLEVNRPGKPVVKCISWDSVDIAWDAVASFGNGDVYQVRCENSRSQKWNCQNFEMNSGKITSLQPGTSYIFSVRLIKKDGEESKYGEISEKVTTKKEPIPGKPLVQRVFADRVELIWEQVDTFCRGDVYEVHVENIDTKENICQTFKINCATIEDLQPDSPYVFKVRLVKQNGQMFKYSDKSGRIKTCSTFASRLVRTRCPVDTNNKGTALYELPLSEVQHATNADAMSIKYQIGETNSYHFVEKTILLLGATGSGKSTFVDSLANYVLGVRSGDPYRFTVMREEDRKKLKDKARSQTDRITHYTFNTQEGTRLKYRLNVVDTPGFGDTRGEQHDKKVIDQIRNFFTAPKEKGVQVIDAVCFFVKAPDCRLTEAQSYIFNAIQSLFGKDIKGNICLLITFADGSDPVVMDAVRKAGLPYVGTFSFNNLPWTADPKAITTPVFWEMSLTSFRALLNHLEQLETKSLQLTKEVLKERHQLELTYHNIQSHINDRLAIMHCIKEEMKILQEHVKEINENRDFFYTVKELKVMPVNLPTNERATNCLICKTTCHDNCSPIFESFTRMCWVFSWITGNCSQCPKNCDWRSHVTTDHRLKSYEVDVTKTYGDMQIRFQEATDKFLTLNEIIGEMRRQHEANFFELCEMLKSMVNCKNRLNKIALSPEQISMNEQIEQLIKAEKTEGKPGFQDRIKQLLQFREEAF